MKKSYKVLSMINSLPVMFPTQFAKNYMKKLENSGMTIENEVEKEKNYLTHLFQYNKPINNIKCK